MVWYELTDLTSFFNFCFINLDFIEPSKVFWKEFLQALMPIYHIRHNLMTYASELDLAPKFICTTINSSKHSLTGLKCSFRRQLIDCPLITLVPLKVDRISSCIFITYKIVPNHRAKKMHLRTQRRIEFSKLFIF